jgi:hypothetical protein
MTADMPGGFSLRQSCEAFAECRGLVALTGPAKGAQHKLNVSFSQFAASNTSRPADFLAGLIPHLIARVPAHKNGGRPEIPASLRILDSTFLRLSIKLAPWVPQSARSLTLSGIRVHVHYAPAMDLPLCTLVTNHADTDYPGMDGAILDNPARLAELRHQTLAMDLGYYSHRRMEQLREARIHWVIPLRSTVSLRIRAELPVQTSLPGIGGQRITVLHDQRVLLGSHNNRAGAVLANVRLVTALVSSPSPRRRDWESSRRRTG